MHGGHSGVGADSGAFCIFINAVAIMSAWAIGTALSLLHIMLFVVVLLAMAPLVGFSMFMLTIVLVMPTGSLALLYHLKLSTHYTLRGCHSNNSSASGTFSVYISGTVGFGLWGVGAALSFILHIFIFKDIINNII